MKRRTRSTERLRVVASPLRQEILGAFERLGQCSVRELADELGRPPDTLYYHLRKLVRVGLLEARGKREATTRHEETYALPSGPLGLEYDMADPANLDAVARAAATSARLAARDVARALEAGAVSGRRGARDLEVTRVTGWLGAAEVRRLRALLAEAETLVREGRKKKGTKRYAVTWVLTPLADRS